MANVYDIIIRPIITERSMVDVANQTYVFEVAKHARKHAPKAVLRVSVEEFRLA